MTKRHALSTADELFRGDAYYAPHASLYEGRRGVLIPNVALVEIPDPIVADPDGIAAAQAVAGPANLTLNGALVSGGVATLDVPRAVQIDSANAGDTTQTITVTGTDEYGATLVEAIDLNGTTAVLGKKAFKTVTQMAISAATAGNVNAGTTNVFGLPYKLAKAADIIAFNADGSVEDATIAAAVTAAATATTGDVRGTVTPTTTPNGTINFAALMKVDAASKESLFGVAQFGG